MDGWGLCICASSEFSTVDALLSTAIWVDCLALSYFVHKRTKAMTRHNIMIHMGIEMHNIMRTAITMIEINYGINYELDCPACACIQGV